MREEPARQGHRWPKNVPVRLRAACALIALAACGRPGPAAPDPASIPLGGRFERSTSFDDAVALVSADLGEEEQSFALSVDLDADGLRDVVVSLGTPWSGARSFVVRQVAPARFAAAEPLPHGLGGCLAATDLDGDGHLDLLFAEPPLAVAWGTEAGIDFGAAARLHPWAHDPIQQVLPLDLDGDARLDLVVATWDRDYVLYREPDGGFVEVPLGGGETFAYCPFDFDLDGRTDLYNMTESLWREGNQNEALRNLGARAWAPLVPVDAAEDRRHYFTPAASPGAVKGTPMGCAWADLLGDETPELFLSQNSCQSPLYTRDAAAGVWRETSVPGLGGRCLDEEEIYWGASFADVDADGRQDLVVAAGHDLGHFEQTGERGASHVHLFWNAGGGRFLHAEPTRYGLGEPGDFQAISTEDVDGDGHVDLLAGGFAQPPRLYWNRLEPRGHTLSIVLAGAATDGTRIEVEAGGVRRTRTAGRENATWRVTSGTTLHVGLGAALDAAVTVHWREGPTEHRLVAAPSPWLLARP